MASKNIDKTRVQMIGSEAGMNTGGPHDMRQSAFPGGMAQIIGSEADLVHKTTPMGEFDKHVRGGREQFVGSMTEMNETPYRGWQSYPAPLSMNSQNPEADESGFPGSGPRRMARE